MKIVLDANVIVAAFASRGLCESIFEFCLSGHEIILCVDLLDEIARNLRLKIKLPGPAVDSIRGLLQEYGTLLDPASLPQDACRDPDDVKILGLAIASSADFIVTGDEDLLVLEECQGIPILSPRSFSQAIRSKL
jgi:putative PIN family toxin of toxin-antitoxin system